MTNTPVRLPPLLIHLGVVPVCVLFVMRAGGDVLVARKKVKVRSCVVRYLLDRSKRSIRYTSHHRPVISDTDSISQDAFVGTRVPIFHKVFISRILLAYIRVLITRHFKDCLRILWGAFYLQDFVIVLSF